MELAAQYPVYIFNTLSRNKEVFKPLVEGMVGLYVCGPTVYSDPHLGHARSALTFDILVRYLRYLGYKVRYVRNITDVGHLEDEMAGAGEDKIAKKAKLEKLEPMEIVQQYTLSYHSSLRKLNMLPPSIEPSASGHIPEQIKMIEAIIKNGFAYVANGSVYFDLEKYAKSHDYGTLSGKVLEDLIIGSRDTEGLDEKRSPLDFALWKKAKPEHIMRWESPWSDGFPGWHLECSAMSSKYLGEHFDIHGGGMDLQFPHHEAEIAQSTAGCGHTPANYWIHNNMITIDGQKMARSLNNFITLEQLFSGAHDKLEQAYSPMVMRFFGLQAHYRSTLDFSNEALQAAEKGYKRLMNTLKVARTLAYEGKEQPDEKLEAQVKALIASTFQNMSDDFNTARTLADLYEMGSLFHEMYGKKIPSNQLSRNTFEELKRVFDDMITQVLGLEPELTESNGALDGTVNLLINLRTKAKKDKNYELSDYIRDELKEIGIQLKDERGGVTTYTLD